MFLMRDLFVNCNLKSEHLPINVILAEHRKFGHILINTGCSELLNKSSFRTVSYKSANSIEFEKGSDLISRLSDDGLAPELIRKVLLTHCVPECCGSLPKLPNYDLISSAQVLCVLDFDPSSDHVMKSTVPPKTIKRIPTGLINRKTVLDEYYRWIYDPLGDGSVLGVDLSGHAKAMMGYYFTEHKILFAADAAIDIRMIEQDYTPSDKMLSNQNNPDFYLSNIMTLRRLHREHPEINIVFLHSVDFPEVSID